MWRTVLRASGATAAFAVIHSCLASDVVKEQVERRLGDRVYLILGSVHEEWRLSSAYGDRYERYKRGIPFFFPLAGPPRVMASIPVGRRLAFAERNDS